MIGLPLILLLGAAARVLATREPLRHALLSPTSLFVGLSLLFSASLGPIGLPLLAALAFFAWWAPRELEAAPPALTRTTLFVFLAAAAWVLARPPVPLFWDEFVWLAKARLGDTSLSGVVDASLDPTLGLIPPGYVPLWPSAVAWLSLGHDALDTHTLAASLLVVACFGAALEAWWPMLRSTSWWGVALALCAPLALVHLRSTYVDLPLGLLGAALLGRMLDGRFGLTSISLAVCLAGFKDEGLTHVLAATLAVFVVPSSVARRARVGPMLAAVIVVATWRLALTQHGVVAFDHALNVPAWGWLPTLGRLLLLHASDALSWGVTWAIVIATVTRAAPNRQTRALRWVLAGNLALLTAALLAGPERVRVFAENGTLLNRLLLQSWPAAVLLIAAMFHGQEPAPPSRS